MAEKNSQSHNNNGAWKRMVDEQSGRMESIYAEMAKVEDKGVERLHSAVDESARLMKDSFSWYSELSTEWRKMSLDATRRLAGWPS